MKSVTYPVRFRQDEYEKLQAEATKRGKTLADLFRDLVAKGLLALEPAVDPWDKLIAESWESLGPAPTVNFDELPKDPTKDW